MAYVICAAGAGGKTTFLTETGKRFVSEGKTVAMTTTTHIWDPKTDAQNGIRFFGTPTEEGKLAAPSAELYREICRNYDIVLVEGDGSHSMPLKIPKEGEPVIPENTDEIVVIMGKHAIGRTVRTVCQRFESVPEEDRLCAGDTVVTEDLMREIAERYYLVPLSVKFPKVKIRFRQSDMFVSGRDADVHRMTLVLLASGFGKRFGRNKLAEMYNGKKMYEWTLDRLLSASKKMPCETDVLVVTQYREIMEEINGRKTCHLHAVMNTEAEEGISASLRIGTKEALRNGSEAAVFFAADMPDLPEEDIRYFLKQFLYSGKTVSCMAREEADREVPGKKNVIPVNPGAFRFREGIPEELFSLRGDRGAMKVIRNHPEECHFYRIEAEKVRDIDRREDLRS